MQPQTRRWPPHGRDPEANLRRVNRAFGALSRRLDRRIKLRRAYRWVGLSMLAATGIVVSYVALATYSPWRPIIVLKHILRPESAGHLASDGSFLG